MVTCLEINDSKKVGRLGNQLFVLAALIGLAKTHATQVLLPEWKYHSIFEHPFPVTESITAYPWKTYTEPHFHFAPILYLDPTNISGYFQSERYFSHATEEVRHHLTPKTDIYKALQAQFKDDLAQNPISLHVRRGDYKKLADSHPTLPLDYYKKAIARFESNSLFLVFSDDIDWCKKAFSSVKSHIKFVENTHDYEDLFLMSMCRHHIIANSSFSWWGAWLNSNPTKQVIAPTPWFGPKLPHLTQDLLPSTWEVVSWHKKNLVLRLSQLFSK